MKIAVLGGGISGLSLSWYLRKNLGNSLKSLTCIEASRNPGGWVESRRYGENKKFLFELGPHSMRPVGPNGLSVLQLIEDVGLEREALGTSNSSKNRYIRINGEMEMLPTSLLGIFRSPLTNQLPFLAVSELFTASRADNDESVHSFITRHFNARTADTLMDSMISGIFAGNIHTLSVKSCFRVLHDMEQKDRSIVLSILKSALFSPRVDFREQLKTDECKSLVGSTGISFTDGMQTLTDRLAEKINKTDKVEVNSTVVSLERKTNDSLASVTIEKEGKTERIEADYIFSTLPIRDLYRVLPKDLSSHIEELNDSIDHVPVGVVNLGYGKEKLPYQGFGHLVPSSEKEGALGMIYDSLVFPNQLKSDDGSVLTVMVGGHHAPEKALLKEEDMIQFALKKISEHLAITADPEEAIATSHIDCIPQYSVGHHERMTGAVDKLKSCFPELEILGNNFYGVGIADSIATAKRKASEFML
mmetsp:Transcript_12670/g.16392  ORF Transcript_12670/g.16392 Transcript_12670/m.16392 type:complete len:475 (-) Transcript_12670:124-1548(-)